MAVQQSIPCRHFGAQALSYQILHNIVLCARHADASFLVQQAGDSSDSYDAFNPWPCIGKEDDTPTPLKVSWLTSTVATPGIEDIPPFRVIRFTGPADDEPTL
jgi:hypothetical protein